MSLLGSIHFACLVILLVVGGATRSLAESPAPRDWIPSFALGGFAHSQAGEAETTTSWPVCAPVIAFDADSPAGGFFGPPVLGCYAEGRPASSGSPNLTSGVPDLRLGLTGPPLEFISKRVRPFVHFGWQFGWRAFDTEVIASQEGNFGAIILPADTNLPINVQGVGTLVTTDIEDAWFAGMGLAVEVPWNEHDLRLLPSIDYYSQRLTLEGSAQRVAERVTAFQQQPFPNAPFSARFPEFRIEVAQASAEKTFHALGPRLGLELDFARNGSVVVSGFLELGAFFFLGDRELSADVTGDAAGVFSLELDPVAIHGGGGIRLSWRPIIGSD